MEPLEYGFEARQTDRELTEWVRSGQRFATIQEAGEALANWLVVCFENSMAFEARLIAYV